MIGETLAKYFPPIAPKWNWQGASGKWYPHNCYPIDAVPEWIKICNYIFVITAEDGKRRPLYIGQNGKFDKPLTLHDKFALAIAHGANEVHIHLLSSSLEERKECEDDLRMAHPTPLNDQRISILSVPTLRLADVV